MLWLFIGLSWSFYGSKAAVIIVCNFYVTRLDCSLLFKIVYLVKLDSILISESDYLFFYGIGFKVSFIRSSLYCILLS